MQDCGRCVGVAFGRRDWHHEVGQARAANVGGGGAWCSPVWTPTLPARGEGMEWRLPSSLSVVSLRMAEAEADAEDP